MINGEWISEKNQLFKRRRADLLHLEDIRFKKIGKDLSLDRAFEEMEKKEEEEKEFQERIERLRSKNDTRYLTAKYGIVKKREKW